MLQIEAGGRDFSLEERLKFEALIFEEYQDFFEEQGFSEET